MGGGQPKEDEAIRTLSHRWDVVSARDEKKKKLKKEKKAGKRYQAEPTTTGEADPANRQDEIMRV
jgi:hypothetical protein